MKSNADKYHWLATTNTNVTIKIGNFDKNNTRSDLCKKASCKIYALSRITPCMNSLKTYFDGSFFQTTVQLLSPHMDVP